MQKVDLICDTGYKKIQFVRGKKRGETELFTLWELYEKRKKIPTSTFVQANWMETNIVLHLAYDEGVREYFKILHLEKTEDGKTLLKNKFNNYINKTNLWKKY